MNNNAPVHQKSVVKRRSAEELKKYKSPLDVLSASSAKQQRFNPVSKPSRNRRHSRRSTLAVQDIKEDRTSVLPHLSESVLNFFANIPAKEPTKPAEEETSEFCIKSKESVRKFFANAPAIKQIKKPTKPAKEETSEFSTNSEESVRKFFANASAIEKIKESAKPAEEETSEFLIKSEESVHKFFGNAFVIEQIKEPTEPAEEETSESWIKSEESVCKFFANAPVIEQIKEPTKPAEEETSEFWIKSEESVRKLFGNAPALEQIKEPIKPADEGWIKSKESLRKFTGNAPAIEQIKEPTKPAEEKTSQFWIKSGDFSIILEIMYNEAEKVRLMYENFCETSCRAKNLNFGIDDEKFSVCPPLQNSFPSKSVPTSKVCSHYWFSTGELIVTFSGKYLAPAKVQSIFRLIKDTVKETGILRFGVDNVEFSNVPEFWYQTPKLAVESQYEGRSKYDHLKPLTDSEKDNFQKIKCDKFSYSALDKNHYDLASLNNIELSVPHKSLDMASSDLYGRDYEKQTLNRFFTESCESYRSYKSCNLSSLTVSEMISVVLNEKRRLTNTVEEQFSSIARAPYIPEDALDNLQGTPEYIEKLQSIVAEINRIKYSTQFKDCTVNELESYEFFLSCYSEVCSKSCSWKRK